MDSKTPLSTPLSERDKFYIEAVKILTFARLDVEQLEDAADLVADFPEPIKLESEYPGDAEMVIPASEVSEELQEIAASLGTKLKQFDALIAKMLEMIEKEDE